MELSSHGTELEQCEEAVRRGNTESLRSLLHTEHGKGSALALPVVIACAEAAFKLNALELAQDACDLYATHDPPVDQLAARRLLVLARVHHHHTQELLKDHSSRGAEYQTRTLSNVKLCMDALTIAQDAPPNTNYDFLVYQTAATYWTVARPLMRAGRRKALRSSLQAITEALQRLQAATANTDKAGKAAAKGAKTKKKKKPAKGSQPDEPELKESKEEEAARTQREHRAEARTEQLVHFLMALSVCQEECGDRGAATTSAASASELCTSLLSLPSAQPFPSTARLSLCMAVMRLQVRLTDGGKGAADIAKKWSAANLSGAEHIITVQSLHSSLPDFDPSAAESKQKGKSSKGGKGGAPASQLANLITELGAQARTLQRAYVKSHQDLDRQRLLHITAILSLAGRVAINKGYIELAKQAVAGAQPSKQYGLHKGFVLAEFTRAETLLAPLGLSDVTTVRQLNSRLEAVKVLEGCLRQAVRLQDPEIIEEGCVALWNACLPLLQPKLRGRVASAIRLCASALESVESLRYLLRVQCHLEAAKCELDVDFLAKAMGHLKAAMSLDYSLALDELTDDMKKHPAVASALSDDVPKGKSSKGGKGKGKGDEKQPDDATDQAQQAEYKAIRESLQWPLDAFIYRTFTRLDLKLSPHRHVETAGEHILVQVEQCRDALNKAMKRSMLTRAIKMLKALDPSTVDTQLISPSDIWYDVTNIAWDARLLDLVHETGQYVLAPQWDVVHQRASIIQQARVRIIEANATALLIHDKGYELGEVYSIDFSTPRKPSDATQSDDEDAKEKQVDASADKKGSKGVNDSEAATEEKQQEERLNVHEMSVEEAQTAEQVLALQTEHFEHLAALVQLAKELNEPWMASNAAAVLWRYHKPWFELQGLSASVGELPALPAALTTMMRQCFDGVRELQPSNGHLLGPLGLALAKAYEKDGKLDECVSVCLAVLELEGVEAEIQVDCSTPLARSLHALGKPLSLSPAALAALNGPKSAGSHVVEAFVGIVLYELAEDSEQEKLLGPLIDALQKGEDERIQRRRDEYLAAHPAAADAQQSTGKGKAKGKGGKGKKPSSAGSTVSAASLHEEKKKKELEERALEDAVRYPEAVQTALAQVWALAAQCALVLVRREFVSRRDIWLGTAPADATDKAVNDKKRKKGDVKAGNASSTHFTEWTLSSLQRSLSGCPVVDKLAPFRDSADSRGPSDSRHHHVSHARWRWYAVAEGVHAQLLCYLVDPTTQDQSSQDKIRGLALNHAVCGAFYATKPLQPPHARHRRTEWSPEASDVALLYRSMKVWWKLAVPFMSLEAPRRVLLPLLKFMLHSAERVIPDNKSTGDDADDDTGDTEANAAHTAHDYKLLRRLYQLLFRCLSENGMYREGFDSSTAALARLPPSEHTHVWHHRVGFMSKLHMDVTAAVGRMNARDPVVKASIWHSLARTAASTSQQFHFQHKALTVLAQSSPLHAVEYLIDYGEWLCANGFPATDAEDQLFLAADILHDVEPSEQDPVGMLPSQPSVSEVSGGSNLLAPGMDRQPSLDRGSSIGSIRSIGSVGRMPRSSTKGSMASSTKRSKRRKKLSSASSIYSFQSAGGDGSTKGPSQLDIPHLCTLARVYTMLALMGSTAAQRQEYSLMAVHYVRRVWATAFSRANYLHIRKKYEKTDPKRRFRTARERIKFEKRQAKLIEAEQRKAPEFSLPGTEFDWLDFRVPSPAVALWATDGATATSGGPPNGSTSSSGNAHLHNGMVTARSLTVTTARSRRSGAGSVRSGRSHSSRGGRKKKDEQSAMLKLSLNSGSVVKPEILVYYMQTLVNLLLEEGQALHAFPVLHFLQYVGVHVFDQRALNSLTHMQTAVALNQLGLTSWAQRHVQAAAPFLPTPAELTHYNERIGQLENLRQMAGRGNLQPSPVKLLTLSELHTRSLWLELIPLVAQQGDFASAQQLLQLAERDCRANDDVEGVGKCMRFHSWFAGLMGNNALAVRLEYEAEKFGGNTTAWTVGVMWLVRQLTAVARAPDVDTSDCSWEDCRAVLVQAADAFADADRLEDMKAFACLRTLLAVNLCGTDGLPSLLDQTTSISFSRTHCGVGSSLASFTVPAALPLSFTGSDHWGSGHGTAMQVHGLREHTRQGVPQPADVRTALVTLAGVAASVKNDRQQLVVALSLQAALVVSPVLACYATPLRVDSETCTLREELTRVTSAGATKTTTAADDLSTYLARRIWFNADTAIHNARIAAQLLRRADRICRDLVVEQTALGLPHFTSLPAGRLAAKVKVQLSQCVLYIQRLIVLQQTAKRNSAMRDIGQDSAPVSSANSPSTKSDDPPQHDADDSAVAHMDSTAPSSPHVDATAPTTSSPHVDATAPTTSSPHVNLSSQLPGAAYDDNNADATAADSGGSDSVPSPEQKGSAPVTPARSSAAASSASSPGASTSTPHTPEQSTARQGTPEVKSGASPAKVDQLFFAKYAAWFGDEDAAADPFAAEEAVTWASDAVNLLESGAAPSPPASVATTTALPPAESSSSSSSGADTQARAKDNDDEKAEQPAGILEDVRLTLPAAQAQLGTALVQLVRARDCRARQTRPPGGAGSYDDVSVASARVEEKDVWDAKHFEQVRKAVQRAVEDSLAQQLEEKDSKKSAAGKASKGAKKGKNDKNQIPSAAEERRARMAKMPSSFPLRTQAEWALRKAIRLGITHSQLGAVAQASLSMIDLCGRERAEDASRYLHLHIGARVRMYATQLLLLCSTSHAPRRVAWERLYSGRSFAGLEAPKLKQLHDYVHSEHSGFSFGDVQWMASDPDVDVRASKSNKKAKPSLKSTEQLAGNSSSSSNGGDAHDEERECNEMAHQRYDECLDEAVQSIPENTVVLTVYSNWDERRLYAGVCAHPDVSRQNEEEEETGGAKKGRGKDKKGATQQQTDEQTAGDEVKERLPHPLVSRVACIPWTPVLSALVQRIARHKAALTQAISDVGASAVNRGLDVVEQQFEQVVVDANQALQHVMDELVVAPEVFRGRDVVLIVDPSLSPLPWEHLSLLTHAKSVTREFSLFTMFHRTTRSAPDTEQKDTTYIADPVNEDVSKSIGHVLNDLNASSKNALSGCIGSSHVPSRQELQLAVSSHGSAIYAGYGRITDQLPAYAIAALERTNSSLVHIADCCVSELSERRQAKTRHSRRWFLDAMDSAYNLALLFSVLGTNTVVLHQHAISAECNAVELGFLWARLLRGESVAVALRHWRGYSFAPDVPSDQQTAATERKRSTYRAPDTPTDVVQLPPEVAGAVALRLYDRMNAVAYGGHTTAPTANGSRK